MRRFVPAVFWLTCFAIPAIFQGCGGGGQGTTASSQLPIKILSWSPPTTFSDNTTVLDLTSDLDGYEIYVNENGVFRDTDSRNGFANASATQFDLSTIPSLLKGKTYYVSMRSVAKNGIKSDFAAPPAPFSF